MISQVSHSRVTKKRRKFLYFSNWVYPCCLYINQYKCDSVWSRIFKSYTNSFWSLRYLCLSVCDTLGLSSSDQFVMSIWRKECLTDFEKKNSESHDGTQCAPLNWLHNYPPTYMGSSHLQDTLRPSSDWRLATYQIVISLLFLTKKSLPMSRINKVWHSLPRTTKHCALHNIWWMFNEEQWRKNIYSFFFNVPSLTMNMHNSSQAPPLAALSLGHLTLKGGRGILTRSNPGMITNVWSTDY